MSGGAGLIRRDERRVVRVRGVDRADYLHRMLSQDVAGLEAGRAADACLLTPKGRLVGVPLVLNVGDALLLDLDRVTVSDVVTSLERTVITEDVVFDEPDGEVARLTLLGAVAPGLSALDALAHEVLPLGGVPVRVLRRDLGRRPAFELFVPEDGMEACVAALVAECGATRLDAAAWDVERVAERIPAWGAELGPEVMPLEARLGDTAVSFSKGCFPGQEPVAMAHHRGHPAQLLVRVALDGAAPSRAGLVRAGRAVGRLTTVAGDAALAYVRYAEVEEGLDLEVEGGGRARILDAR